MWNIIKRETNVLDSKSEINELYWSDRTFSMVKLNSLNKYFTNVYKAYVYVAINCLNNIKLYNKSNINFRYMKGRHKNCSATKSIMSCQSWWHIDFYFFKNMYQSYMSPYCIPNKFIIQNRSFSRLVDIEQCNISL